jgi:hypothetical protein
MHPLLGVLCVSAVNHWFFLLKPRRGFAIRIHKIGR